jgi:hypothetical protein
MVHPDPRLAVAAAADGRRSIQSENSRGTWDADEYDWPHTSPGYPPYRRGHTLAVHDPSASLYLLGGCISDDLLKVLLWLFSLFYVEQRPSLYFHACYSFIPAAVEGSVQKFCNGYIVHFWNPLPLVTSF